MAAGRERNAPGTSSSVHDAPGAAERATGFEPVTSSLGSWHSTPELRPQSPPVAKAMATARPAPCVASIQHPLQEQSPDMHSQFTCPAAKPKATSPLAALYRHATTPGCSTFSLN